MLGVSLSFYKQELKRVPVHLNKKPVETLNMRSLIKEEIEEEDLEFYFGKSLNRGSEDHYHRIPLTFYKEKSLDHLTKIKHSSFVMMDSSIEKLYEEDLNYEIIRKIGNSFWRYGLNKGKWNDLVHAYNCIRSFNFKHPDFDVRLDHTTWFNEKGYSKYTETFLDGVFSYVVYYKGQHVMTLGFSLSANRKLLIQQVQLKKPRGNRWLFRLPRNYLEYVLERFKETFPGYRMYVVNGEDIARDYLASYTRSLNTSKEKLDKYLADPDRYPFFKREEEHYFTLKQKVEHVRADIPRLKTLYENTGSFVRQKPILTYHGLRHHLIKQV